MLAPLAIDAILARASRIPIFKTLRMHVDLLEEGVCQVKVRRKNRCDGVFASSHGGLLMTVADSAACFAILILTGADERLTTTDMSIRFLAPSLNDLSAKGSRKKNFADFSPGFGPDLVDLSERNHRNNELFRVLREGRSAEDGLEHGRWSGAWMRKCEVIFARALRRR